MNNQTKSKKINFTGTAALMGLLILAAKLMGLLRDSMIAGAYGTTSPEAIAYETASRLPITVFDLVLGGVVTAAFIPVYNSLSVKEGKKEALSFAQSYLNLILLITAGLTLVGSVFAPVLVRFMAPELTAESHILAIELTRIMFPMVFFCGLAFFCVGYLQSEGEYNIPALISLVSNLIMVIYLLFCNDAFGIHGLAVAMVLGWGAQAAVQLPSLWRHGFRPRLRAPLGSEPIRRAAGNILPILLGTWTAPVCNLINTRLASGIAAGRAITVLGYANRLYTIIVGVFSFVATNLLFPHFAKATAAGDNEGNNRMIRTSVKTLVFLIAPISVGIAVLAEPFTALIYENGSFTSEDTLLTAEALRCYAVGMVFCAVNEVLTKVFFAVEKTKIPMISALLAMGFNLAAVTLFGERLGIGGIALVSGLSVFVNMTANAIAAGRLRLVTPLPGDWLDLGKSLLSALLMGGAVYAVHNALPALSPLPALAVSILAGIAAYALLTLLLRSEEMKLLTASLFKKLRKEDSHD